MSSLVLFLIMGAPFAVVVFKLQALISTRLQFLGAICTLLPFLIISQNSVFMWLPLAWYSPKSLDKQCAEHLNTQ
jgi:hypothetical protein